MRTAATQVESAVSTINGLQSNMNSYASELQGHWQGQAAQAFQRAFEAFSADFGKVLSGLESIHEKLVGTTTSYVATEEANTSTANKIAGQL
ncbi:MAG: WXG100 family type VII secretion target [Nocardiopsaceae bacterium]|nr:WXG100 family type VII secretion target [Nocardiopsaceae bacterium]